MKGPRCGAQPRPGQPTIGMGTLLPACLGVLPSEVDGEEMPDRMMRRARLPGGNAGACPGRLPAIGGKAAGPVSVYGMTETSRSTDVRRSPNRSGRRSGSGAAHPGLLPLPCPVAVGGAGTRAGRVPAGAPPPRAGQGVGERPGHVFTGLRHRLSRR